MSVSFPMRLKKCLIWPNALSSAFTATVSSCLPPLYLSNYCVNGCTYCPYHMKNKHIARKKLTQEEIRREVIALQDMGHKRLALEAGEDPKMNPLEYIFGKHPHRLFDQA